MIPCTVCSSKNVFLRCSLLVVLNIFHTSLLTYNYKEGIRAMKTYYQIRIQLSFISSFLIQIPMPKMAKKGWCLKPFRKQHSSFSGSSLISDKAIGHHDSLISLQHKRL